MKKLTKEKIRWVIKRLPYIKKMIKLNIKEKYFYISNKKELIIIDNDVLTIINIMGEIINSEKQEWLKKIFLMISKGYKDVKIIISSPIERSKYYLIKEKLTSKIFQCCIYKGLVDYIDILEEKIE